MIVIHGLKSCDTCRRALKTLRDAGREGRLRDLRADPPDEEEIARWLEILGPGLLNTRSTTWRALSETDRAADPVALMRAHPALVKRPIVADGDALHLGWTDEVRAALRL